MQHELVWDDSLAMAVRSTHITVRCATQLDANALAALNHRFNDEECTVDEMATRLADMPATESVLVAQVDGRIVGFACVQMLRSICYSVPWAELTELYVDAPYRRRGVGRTLMHHAEQVVWQQGISEIILRTGADNSVGQCFYRSLGYQHQDEMLMEKQLDGSNNR